METEQLLKKVRDYIRQGVLPGVDVLHEDVDVAAVQIPKELAVVTRDSLMLLQKRHPVDWLQLDRLRAHSDRGKRAGYTDYIRYFSLPQNEQILSPVIEQHPLNILFSYLDGSAKHKVDDFVQHFTQRYNMLEKMLHIRPELQNSISI